MDENLFSRKYSLEGYSKLDLDFSAKGRFSLYSGKGKIDYSSSMLSKQLLDENRTVSISDLFLLEVCKSHRGEINEKGSSLCCRCFGVTQENVDSHLSKAYTPMEILETTGAGSGCGKCFKGICRLFSFEKKSFEKQKVKLKKLTPVSLLEGVIKSFPKIEIKEFYENVLYISDVNEEKVIEIEEFVFRELNEKVFVVLV